MKRKIATTLSVALIATYCSAKDLSSKEQLKYAKDKTFDEICFAPEDASKKVISQHSFQVLYSGLATELPEKYKDALPRDYAQVKTMGEHSDKVLLVYSKKDDELLKKFNKLLPDTNIIVYGKLRHKKVKVGKVRESLYTFQIEDLREHNPVDDLIVNNFQEKDYTKVETKELDVYLTNYLDQKIKIPIHIKGISNNFNKSYSKIGGMTLEDFFVLKIIEPLSLDILVYRNSQSSKKIIASNSTNALYLCGRLLKLEDPTSKKFIPSYYFMLDGITDREETEEEKAKFFEEADRLKD